MIGPPIREVHDIRDFTPCLIRASTRFAALEITNITNRVELERNRAGWRITNIVNLTNQGAVERPGPRPRHRAETGTRRTADEVVGMPGPRGGKRQ